MQKLKNKQARPKFTGSYKKKQRVLGVFPFAQTNWPWALVSYYLGPVVRG